MSCRKIAQTLKFYKVNRCLARYSPQPHATTTNWLPNRALNKPAWPGPNWPKMPILGQIGSFLGKKSFFYWRNQKFCYPHNGKPTQAPCSHWFLVGHWTKCAKNGNIWPKMTKNADFGPNMAIFGPKILILMGVSKSFGTNITENHLDNLSALFLINF